MSRRIDDSIFGVSMSNPTKRPEVVVITGAGAGVGRATVREFARRGAHVALIARGRDGLEGARREVERAGGRALVLPLDVADADAVEQAAEVAERELGPIDVWVNNAMVSVFSPVREMRAEEYRRVTEVTYLGVVHGTLAALQRMLARDRGTIVQVGSALAHRGIPLQSAYCAAKHAVDGFHWAAHHRRRELWVGLPTAMVIVGNRILPGLGDRYLARTGYDSQQTDQPVDENRPDNLYEPVPGDHGAHGDFDEQSHEKSPQLWATEHLGLLALAGGAGLLAAAALFGRR